MLLSANKFLTLLESNLPTVVVLSCPCSQQKTPCPYPIPRWNACILGVNGRSLSLKDESPRSFICGSPDFQGWQADQQLKINLFMSLCHQQTEGKILLKEEMLRKITVLGLILLKNHKS